MSDARATILERIRAANGAGPALPEAQASWAAIPRTFRRGSALSRGEILELFTDRLHDYDAQVLTTSFGNAAETVARMLHARGATRIVIPEGFTASFLPPGFVFVTDGGLLSTAEIDSCDGVLTESSLGIAETGTLVLQNVPGQGRRAVSLVPDYHLCLVRTADVVATVPEAIARLEATASLPTTFISGPSATADIEMTRIKGVHGPRFLDVLLLEDV